MTRRFGNGAPPLLKRAKGVYPVGARQAVALQLMDVMSCDEGRRLLANLARVRELQAKGSKLDDVLELAALAEFLTGQLLP